MGEKQKRLREAEIQQRASDVKRAKLASSINVKCLYGLLRRCSTTDTIDMIVKLLLPQLKVQTSPFLSVASIIRDNKEFMTPRDWNTEIGEHTLQLTFTDNQNFSTWDERFKRLENKIDNQNIKIDLLQKQVATQATQIATQATQIATQATTIVVLNARVNVLQKEASLARELAINECRDIANKILVLAASGWNRDNDTRNNSDVFKQLAEQEFLINSPFAKTFAKEAIALNSKRNKHVHPTPWAALREQVESGVDVYLKVKKVRTRSEFASFVIENCDNVVPNQYKV